MQSDFRTSNQIFRYNDIYMHYYSNSHIHTSDFRNRGEQTEHLSMHVSSVSSRLQVGNRERNRAEQSVQGSRAEQGRTEDIPSASGVGLGGWGSA
jgi:hypothetical protein